MKHLVLFWITAEPTNSQGLFFISHAPANALQGLIQQHLRTCLWNCWKVFLSEEFRICLSNRNSTNCFSFRGSRCQLILIGLISCARARNKSTILGSEAVTKARGSPRTGRSRWQPAWWQCCSRCPQTPCSPGTRGLPGHWPRAALGSLFYTLWARLFAGSQGISVMMIRAWIPLSCPIYTRQWQGGRPRAGHCVCGTSGMSAPRRALCQHTQTLNCSWGLSTLHCHLQHRHFLEGARQKRKVRRHWKEIWAVKEL